MKNSKHRIGRTSSKLKAIRENVPLFYCRKGGLHNGIYATLKTIILSYLLYTSIIPHFKTEREDEALTTMLRPHV